MAQNKKRTNKIKRRYNRLASMYSFMDKGMARGTKKWRHKLFAKIQGPLVLEVGVGTGINLPYYNSQLQVTAIDFSPKMLKHAAKVVAGLDFPISLLEMDVQALDFPDASFDTVLTSCVFCSVPDPILGLREIKRVLKPGGRVLMLEHVLSCRPGLRQLMNLLNPIVVAMAGSNINRNTVENLELVGFQVQEEDLWLDILKFIVATKDGREEG